jgi:hypothetical protein
VRETYMAVAMGFAALVCASANADTQLCRSKYPIYASGNVQLPPGSVRAPTVIRGNAQRYALLRPTINR